MQASGKTIVVTGGGNGIGREMVLALLAKGAHVAAIDISEEGLAETRSLAGESANRLSTHPANITDRAAVEALPAAVITAHGQVDGLINCAGIIQPFVRINDLDYAAIERVLNVNLWGVIYMTKTFLPYLLERPEAHIVNVSSMGSYVPVPGQTLYGASKAAVKLFTEGLHSELAGTKVRVTVAFPGSTSTNITEHSGVKVDTGSADTSKYKLTSASEAARRIIEGMERNAFQAFAGNDAQLMFRLSRLMPEKAAAMIQKQMAALLDH